MNKHFLILAALLAAPALAQVTPLIFERENIRIEATPTKAQTADMIATIARPTRKYDVEIRPEDALRLEYIHSLNNLTDETGVMIAFTAPGVVPLPSWQSPTPVDVLFVSQNGTITQILPNTVLSDLRQDVVAQDPVKAFLFLKSGTVTTHGIRPGDVIVSRKFIPVLPLMK